MNLKMKIAKMKIAILVMKKMKAILMGKKKMMTMKKFLRRI
jgi:hypothetical protein